MVRVKAVHGPCPANLPVHSINNSMTSRKAKGLPRHCEHRAASRATDGDSLQSVTFTTPIRMPFSCSLHRLCACVCHCAASSQELLLQVQATSFDAAFLSVPESVSSFTFLLPVVALLSGVQEWGGRHRPSVTGPFRLSGASREPELQSLNELDILCHFCRCPELRAVASCLSFLTCSW